jgi:peptide deformylase
MHEDLKIILWPDPRLTKVSKAVDVFDENLKSLAARMFELMRQAKGVGLAAPQVGHNIRLFITNHNGEPGSDRVYVNPVLVDADGEEQAEEGCLSLPKINIDVIRSKAMRIKAMDSEGKPFELMETGYLARVWQHETDHLNGILLIDRMGPVAKMANRKLLKELRENYAAAHPAPAPKRKPKKTRSAK